MCMHAGDYELMVCDMDVKELTYQELSVDGMPIYSAPAKIHPNNQQQQRAEALAKYSSAWL